MWCLHDFERYLQDLGWKQFNIVPCFLDTQVLQEEDNVLYFGRLNFYSANLRSFSVGSGMPNLIGNYYGDRFNAWPTVGAASVYGDVSQFQVPGIYADQLNNGHITTFIAPYAGSKIGFSIGIKVLHDDMDFHFGIREHLGPPFTYVASLKWDSPSSEFVFLNGSGSVSTTDLEDGFLRVKGYFNVSAYAPSGSYGNMRAYFLNNQVLGDNKPVQIAGFKLVEGQISEDYYYEYENYQSSESLISVDGTPVQNSGVDMVFKGFNDPGANARFIGFKAKRLG